jgi:hypothetical protein
MSVITITFSEAVENHVGNQQIGQRLEVGLSVQQLNGIKEYYDRQGLQTEMIDLSPLINGFAEAKILVIRNYLDRNEHHRLYNTLSNLNWDKKCKMKGKVVNKHARHNLCFADFDQVPDYDQGQGRVYNFNQLPELDAIRNNLSDLLNLPVPINAEGNNYYDARKCYIAYHGDRERRIVIGLRLGEQFPLYYKGFQRSEPISEPLEIMLNGGDMYFMSDKAVGYDWHKKIIPTLRHAAGFTVN